MKVILLGLLSLPSIASAAGFVEAVSVTQLTGLENTYPAWSPDRTKLAFESSRDGPDADIFLMNADGTGVIQLTRNEVYDGTPLWSPDGMYLVFATERDGNPEVYRMRTDGPDGRLIYFNSNRSSDPASFARGTMERDQNHEIYSMTPTGGEVRRVTDFPDWDTYPAVSPDGRQLLWRRVISTGGKSESGRNSEVFWMDLATGELRNITANQAYDGWPAWSPDGTKIAFASNRANTTFEAFDIYIANPDGSDLVRVTFGDGIEGRGSWAKPSFSADGKRILCTRSIGTSVDIFVIVLR